MKKILVIIPAFNEEESILNVYNSIRNFSSELDCIVINDASIDSTRSILEKNNIPHIDLVHNLGIGGAVQTGYKYAYYNNYDYAVQFDGDGQHNIEYIYELIDSIEKEGNDLVIGSRYIIKDSDSFQSTQIRQFGIKIISIFIKSVTRKKIYDTTSGYRACNKSIIKCFANSYPIEYPEPVSTVEVLKRGYKVGEIFVKMNERQGGVSSIRAWKTAYYMLNVVLSILIASFRRYK